MYITNHLADEPHATFDGQTILGMCAVRECSMLLVPSQF